MTGHPRSKICGPYLTLKFGLGRFLLVLETVRFLYFGVLSWNCLFTPAFRGFWGHISPNDFTYCSSSEKEPPCTETRRLSHRSWNRVSGLTSVRARAKCRKKQSKTPRRCYFTLLGRRPRWTDLHQNLRGGCSPRPNHECMVLNWTSLGLRFHGDRIFDFPTDSCMGFTTCIANALPVIRVV